jgi:hypothetical protein
MPKKYDITFHEVQEPILEPVTKFGGQPVWLEDPVWPVSRETGKPMQFICQVALYPEFFGHLPGQMAYLFMTGDPEGQAETWDPDAGENAVVIQPGSYEGLHTAQATGPSLYRIETGQGQGREIPCEYSASLEPGEDPSMGEVEAEEGRWEDLEDSAVDQAADALREKLDGNKIGGTPWFIQGTEYPSDDRVWLPLLQITPDVPFWINLGDAGSGYGFISEDGTVGKFLWQCL